MVKFDLKQRINQTEAPFTAQAQQKVSQLQQEIALLREQGVEQNISLSQIKLNPYQPRRTFTCSSIATLARSLSNDGQLQPIILISDLDEQYILWDGERRFRAAQKLQWKSLNALIRVRPDNFRRLTLQTFLQREDLNLLDKAEAIAEILSEKINCPVDSLNTQVRGLARKIERLGWTSQIRQLLTESPEKQQQVIQEFHLEQQQAHILSTLLDLQINPGSFASQEVKMLGLYPDLKVAIRNQGLQGTHALAIQKLSPQSLALGETEAREVREQAVKMALANRLSVAKTRELVKTFLEKYNPNQDCNSELTPKKRLAHVVSRLQKSSIWSDPKMSKKVEKIINQLEQLATENN